MSPDRDNQTAEFDAIVLGAGAAGLFCAGEAAQRGLRVLLVDHGRKVAEKIRISGGGRCNFTNRDLDPRAPQRHFLSANPNFCRSALARFTPQHFITLMQQAGIAFHEKHKGQLFCDERAQALIDWLVERCTRFAVQRWQPAQVLAVAREQLPGQDICVPGRFCVQTSMGEARAPQLVVATGGLSIPKIGASDLGYRIARKFGVPVVAQRPGLVPLVFSPAQQGVDFAALAGVALPVRVRVQPAAARPDMRTAVVFDEDLLFTHRGLSGPAILQISSYWQPGDALCIDLLPGQDALALLRAAKAGSRKQLVNIVAQWLPQRLTEAIVAEQPQWQRPIDQVSDRALTALAERLQRWQLMPNGSEGYAKAEVTVGGVDTQALSSKTMECRQVPGLYFIGEVVDVTGWLGGYNFQWAWASAYACAQALREDG
ncbi:membrane protein [Lampropedia cohaerens]|uniref:Membrane protein n=1 Tax=Lampropedia cohaerens TaxID=1610491 RepID=A0A0U1PX73_9BURK|nr:NAD(P)/FAD-dependent oxidoreductase [Lampropedia cohaerens]KKW67056.1 membrane protein [Lampropedia cohaerens]